MSREDRCGALQFAAWAAVGFGALAGVLTVLTLGFFVLLATGGLALLLIRRADGRLAVPGLLAGAAVLPFYVGFLNRDGPGMVCTTTRTGGSCVQEMSPWPWVAVGLCLAGAGAGLYVLLRRRSTRARVEHAGTRPARHE
jgi:hypothetical protein